MGEAIKQLEECLEKSMRNGTYWVGNKDFSIPCYAMLCILRRLTQRIPKWISVENPPQVEGEYIVIVQLPDGKKERMWDIYHPYHGWCEDAENKVICWMSFDSLPEPQKDG